MVLAHLDPPQVKAPFRKHLPPNHGIFYSAWKCHLLAGITTIKKGKDRSQTQRLRAACDSLSSAIKNSGTPFLCSHTVSAWSCDSIPAYTHFQAMTDSHRKVAIRMSSQTGSAQHNASIQKPVYCQYNRHQRWHQRQSCTSNITSNRAAFFTVHQCHLCKGAIRHFPRQFLYNFPWCTLRA